MRKHQKRWIALAGATTLSVAGLVAGGTPATAEHRHGDDPLAWPVVQQSASTYRLDGFEVAYLPPGLDRYGVHADSSTGRAGERVSTITWVQGPDSVYGKVAVIRSEDVTDLEDLRTARYGRLDDDALERIEHNGSPAYLSQKTGELFWVPEEGVGVEAYLQPDRWDPDELASMAEGVRRAQQAGSDGAASDEGGADEAASDGAESGEGAPEGAAEEAGVQDEAGAGEAPEAAEEAADSEDAQSPASDGAGEAAGSGQDSADSAEEAAEGAQDQEAAENAEEAAAGTGQDAETLPADTESEAPEDRQESEAPEADGPQSGSGSQQQTGEQEGADPVPGAQDDEAAEDAGEAAAGTGQDGSGTESGEESDAGTPDAEAPDAQEVADGVEGSFVPGVSVTDVRSCLAEELLGEDAQAQPAEVAADDAALLELWRTADAEARTEAARTCGERFEAAPELVEEMMADLAAEAEEAEGAEEPAEAADAGAGGAAAQETAEESDASGATGEAAESADSDDDPSGLWDAIPLSLPRL